MSRGHRNHNNNSGNDTINGNSGNNYINGGRGNDTINGNGGHDWLVGGRGNDMVNGGDGCDVVFGGSGNDIVDGGNGNDWVFGGSGSDIVIGGAGSDIVFAGRGDDEAIYNMARNDGARDYYSGGRGNDTLTLEFTADEWAQADVRADVENYLQALEDQANSTSWWHRFSAFTFESFDLTVRSFENLKILVDGVETDPNNAAPTYNGDVLNNSATGNLAVDPLATQDLKDFFDDADGDTLTFTAASLPDGLTLTSDGLLQQSATFDPTDLSLVGDQVFTVTVDDGNGGSIDQDLSFTVAMEHDFGNGFAAGSGSSETVTGSSIDDRIVFDNNAANDGELSVDALFGNDEITFGGNAARGGGEISIVAPGGNNDITFADNAGFIGGSVTVTAADGDDTISFGNSAARQNGDITLDVGNGDNAISFVGNAARDNGTISITSGDGADTISMSNRAAQGNGVVDIDSGAGDDQITFGTFTALLNGTINVDTGDGNDRVSFGSESARGGDITVETGAGDDVISLAREAARNNGTFEIFAGAGADAVNIGVDGGILNGTINIDLGAADGAIDAVLFRGDIFNTTISNWETGIDTVDVVDPMDWTGNDNGTDTTFTTTDGQSITFDGITGLGTDFDDFLI